MHEFYVRQRERHEVIGYTLLNTDMAHMFSLLQYDALENIGILL
jgi:hypothetical protein